MPRMLQSRAAPHNIEIWCLNVNNAKGPEALLYGE